MITSFDDIREAVLHLPKGDQMRLLSLVALKMTGTHPGIDSQPQICGGSARIIRTRIPVWLLEALRRDGRSEAELLADYPSPPRTLPTPGTTPAANARKWTAKSPPTGTRHDRKERFEPRMARITWMKRWNRKGSAR